MDAARQWTDKKLKALEKRISREYSTAAREMREKQREHLEQFASELEQREKALDGTEEALAAHKRWLSSQAAHNSWMGAMVDELSISATTANQKAAELVNDAIPGIYAENANRAAYAVDKAIKADTEYTLVNEDAVRELIQAGDRNAPIYREINRAKDIRWNRQQFTSAITQGILQGESIPQIIKRTTNIYGKNRASAIRAARTATTNAENMGRMSSFERAQRLGIDMEIEWQATLDGRTRDTHRALDGERIQLGEKFSNGLRWPGDPQGAAAEVYNCRCRADGDVVGFGGVRGDWGSEPQERWARLPYGITYEKWKKGKATSRARSYQAPARRVDWS